MTQSKKQLGAYVHEIIVHKVECGGCGKVREEEYDNWTGDVPSDADERFKVTGRALFIAGWRELNSEEHGAIIIACSDCVALLTKGPKATLVQRR